MDKWMVYVCDSNFCLKNCKLHSTQRWEELWKMVCQGYLESELECSFLIDSLFANWNFNHVLSLEFLKDNFNMKISIFLIPWKYNRAYLMISSFGGWLLSRLWCIQILYCRFLIQDPNLRLGANGAAEVVICKFPCFFISFLWCKLLWALRLMHFVYFAG